MQNSSRNKELAHQTMQIECKLHSCETTASSQADFSTIDCNQCASKENNGCSLKSGETFCNDSYINQSFDLSEWMNKTGFSQLKNFNPMRRKRRNPKSLATSLVASRSIHPKQCSFSRNPLLLLSTSSNK